jgi:circadian clock protein KaiB
MRKDRQSIEAELERPHDDPHYVMSLYVTGMSHRSLEAVEAIKAICEEHLRGHYELEVIDIYQRPAIARSEQIIAAPTLVKRLPYPLRRLIGNLSDTDRVLHGLDLLAARKDL